MNLAVQELVKKLHLLMDEQTKLNEKFNKEISEIETAIETLSGKTVWEVNSEYHYDDENPDYIKASQEEI